MTRYFVAVTLSDVLTGMPRVRYEKAALDYQEVISSMTGVDCVIPCLDHATLKIANPVSGGSPRHSQGGMTLEFPFAGVYFGHCFKILDQIVYCFGTACSWRCEPSYIFFFILRRKKTAYPSGSRLLFISWVNIYLSLWCCKYPWILFYFL